jgi:hypothetical protein
MLIITSPRKPVLSQNGNAGSRDFQKAVPLALAWARFSVQLLPDLLVDREQ